ncbi:redoxin domain-containing protein [Roseiconus nitratireducens]|uniref:Redoxin domain-containing protein n=1 Tax=Roseiconus nitratireducens TaxID=2605748 RepID=A0A5M6CYV6_9BACT|nr:redoxin domain-containing protein [Roseiconus nitratireducens]KAA5540404.1 redoxin domain-containing protein [Roseiconus nitratireducens]
MSPLADPQRLTVRFQRRQRIFQGRQRVSTGTLSVAVLLLLAGMGSVRAAGPEQPLEVGAKAPDFELPVQGEETYLRLSDMLADGPVVVIFLRGYPGYQCGICNRQVGSLINRAAALGKATGNQPRRVVLIYPGEEDRLERHADQFLGSRRLPEPLVMVRDPGLQTVTEWGLRWDEPRETAYPATYVIGPGRRVQWAKVSESHAGRSTVEEVLQAIRRR